MLRSSLIRVKQSFVHTAKRPRSGTPNTRISHQNISNFNMWAISETHDTTSRRVLGTKSTENVYVHMGLWTLSSYGPQDHLTFKLAGFQHARNF